MTKIKGKYINKSECLMPSALTHSNIFQVVAKEQVLLKKEWIKLIFQRTKEEALSYHGYRLDLKRDYPILHILLREKQKQNTDFVNINLNSVLKELGVQVRKEERLKLFTRIEDFKHCDLSVTKLKSKSDELPSVSTSLVLRIEKQRKPNLFTIQFPPEIDQIVSLFNTQTIDLSIYNKLKRQASMAIYLTLRSHAFISRKKLNLSFEKFSIRYDKSRSEKQITQDIKKGFDELVKLKVIKSCKGYTADNDKKMFAITM